MQNNTSEKRRDYEFTARHFDVLRDLVSRHTGITLADSKKELVYGRIVRRIRTLGLDGFDHYCRLVKTNPDGELSDFVNAITTNKTDFFRESHHFDFMAKTAIPYLLKARNVTHRLRIWSAGCSSGQEPYSIAIVLKEAIPHINSWDVKILATDIDSNVLAKAQAGIYQEEQIAEMSDPRRKRWFHRGKGEHGGMVRVSNELQELIHFKRLNLMEDWPFSGPFDLIFCRNVVIYFDKQTQARLFDRYADILADDGQLFIGHSESLFNVSNRYEHLGQTIHKKIA